MRQQRGGNSTPPVGAVLDIPVCRLLDPLLPRGALRPSQRLELLVVDEVPVVVERPVADRPDCLAGVQAEEPADVTSNVDDAALPRGADVVDAANLSPVEHNVERLGYVLAVEVAPDMGAVAVHGERAAAHGEEDELGDELLRELVRAVDVVAPRGDGREAVRARVGHDEHLGGGLAGGVRVGGEQLRGLVVPHGGVLVRLAVDLVGADVDEAADGARAGAAAGLEEDVGAEDVVLGELEGVVDVGLRGEVHDGVDALAVEEVEDEVGGGHVGADEAEVGGRESRGQVVEAGAVVELVQGEDAVPRVVADQAVGHVRRDEPRCAGDEDVLRHVLRRRLHCRRLGARGGGHGDETYGPIG